MTTEKIRQRDGHQRARRAPCWLIAAVLLVAALCGTALVPTAPAAAGEDRAAPAPGGGTPADDPDALAQLRREVRDSGSTEVVVRLRVAPDASPAAVTATAGALVTEIAPAAPDDVAVLDRLGVLTLQAGADELDRLARSPLVARLEPDLLLAPALDGSAAQIGAPLAWQNGLTGAGMAVAVIDSGIDGSHPALAGKVVHEACFTADSCPNGRAVMIGPGAAVPCPWGSGCEHGTEVAGVVAAGSDRPGVAPGAVLAAVQVFSPVSGPACGAVATCARARTSDLLAALDHLDEVAVSGSLGRRLVAVNISLASDATFASCNDSILAAAVDRLWNHGVATVVAAGNSSRRDGLSIPACIERTVSVGGVDGNDAYWPVSNVSAALDFFAPGVAVTTTAPGGTWRSVWGTSVAAPHVAGAWAVAAQALGPAAGPEQIAAWFRARPERVAAAGLSIPRISLVGLRAARPAPWAHPENLRALVADYDGNGYDDIYWFDRTGEASQIWWYGPAGQEAATPSAMGGAWRPVAGDFNADGVGDLVWYNPEGATYFWFGRRTRGLFEGTGPFYPWGDFTPFAGDFNGDGYDDVYLYGRNGGPSYILWMTATPGWPGFATVASVGIPQAPDRGLDPTAGDLDGDGDADIVWQGATASYLEWSQRDGTFDRRWAVPGAYQTAVADLDGDTVDDLVLYAPGNTWLWWGGIDPATSYPRAGRWLGLDAGPGATMVPGRFLGSGRDDLYFYGPATPADTYHRIALG